ncbi:MAG TPA: hypothetical protein PL033_02290 [Candidatus Brocadiia bacterium]|nr:hypothetical protein [Candidatus Brocadiia bacterium]
MSEKKNRRLSVERLENRVMLSSVVMLNQDDDGILGGGGSLAWELEVTYPAPGGLSKMDIYRLTDSFGHELKFTTSGVGNAKEFMVDLKQQLTDSEGNPTPDIGDSEPNNQFDDTTWVMAGSEDALYGLGVHSNVAEGLLQIYLCELDVDGKVLQDPEGDPGVPKVAGIDTIPMSSLVVGQSYPLSFETMGGEPIGIQVTFIWNEWDYGTTVGSAPQASIQIWHNATGILGNMTFLGIPVNASASIHEYADSPAQQACLGGTIDFGYTLGRSGTGLEPAYYNAAPTSLLYFDADIPLVSADTLIGLGQIIVRGSVYDMEFQSLQPMSSLLQVSVYGSLSRLTVHEEDNIDTLSRNTYTWIGVGAVLGQAEINNFERVFLSGDRINLLTLKDTDDARGIIHVGGTYTNYIKSYVDNLELALITGSFNYIECERGDLHVYTESIVWNIGTILVKGGSIDTQRLDAEAMALTTRWNIGMLKTEAYKGTPGGDINIEAYCLDGGVNAIISAGDFLNSDVHGTVMVNTHIGYIIVAGQFGRSEPLAEWLADPVVVRRGAINYMDIGKGGVAAVDAVGLGTIIIRNGTVYETNVPDGEGGFKTIDSGMYFALATLGSLQVKSGRFKATKFVAGTSVSSVLINGDFVTGSGEIRFANCGYFAVTNGNILAGSHIEFHNVGVVNVTGNGTTTGLIKEDTNILVRGNMGQLVTNGIKGTFEASVPGVSDAKDHLATIAVEGNLGSMRIQRTRVNGPGGNMVLAKVHVGFNGGQASLLDLTVEGNFQDSVVVVGATNLPGSNTLGMVRVNDITHDAGHKNKDGNPLPFGFTAIRFAYSVPWKTGADALGYFWSFISWPYF